MGFVTGQYFQHEEPQDSLTTKQYCIRVTMKCDNGPLQSSKGNRKHYQSMKQTLKNNVWTTNSQHVTKYLDL